MCIDEGVGVNHLSNGTLPKYLHTLTGLARMPQYLFVLVLCLMTLGRHFKCATEQKNCALFRTQFLVCAILNITTRVQNERNLTFLPSYHHLPYDLQVVILYLLHYLQHLF